MSDEHNGLSADEVIEKFGGLRPLANRLGIAPSTVQGWKERGVVPENRIPEVMQAAQEDGIVLGVDAAAPTKPEPVIETAKPEPQDVPVPATKSEPPAPKAEQTVTEPDASKQQGSRFMTPQADTDIENERRDYSDRRSAGDRRQAIDPNYKGRERRTGDRRSGLDRRQQRAAEWAHKKKFVERSILTFVFLFIIIILAAVFLLMPEYRAMQERASQYENMQRELTAVNQRLENMTEDRSSISGRINEGISQLERVKDEIMKQVQTVEQTASQMANSNWQQNLSMAEQKIYGLSSMMSQVQGLLNAPGGAQALENSMQALRDTLGHYGGTMTAQDLNAIRQEDPILSTVMKDVRAEDVQAGLMLLTLNEIRGAMGREETPFSDDLRLLQMLNRDNPTMQAAIQRLAPYASSGVLSQERLSGEFQGLAGEIVMAKMRGEDASIQNRAMERLSRMMTVRRVDETEGNSADAIVVRAQMKIDQGDIQGAIAELQQLEGESAKAAAPWINEAQSRVYAEQASRALTMDVMQSLLSGQNLTPEGVQSIIGRLLQPMAGGGSSPAVVSQPARSNPGAIPNSNSYPGLTR